MFAEDLWESWSEQESKNYKIKNGRHIYEKKGYIHFDHRFWFPERKGELKRILQNGLLIYKKELDRTEYWSFSPFLKLLVKTPRYRYQELEGYHNLETKIRPICFASHIDSLIFGFYSFCLSKRYEAYIKNNGFDECVLAYRSDLGKCNIQFSKEVFEIVKARGACSAIALDIKGYFDHIDHVILKDKWEKVIGGRLPEDQYRIFKSITQYSYVSKRSLLRKYNRKKRRKGKTPPTLLELLPGKLNHEKFQALRDNDLIVKNDAPDQKTARLKGIPQGSALSALLSNLYLIDYDQIMQEKSRVEGFVYRRYCDDIVIICDTDKVKELKEFAMQTIAKEYFLKIQDKKVEIIDFRQNSKGKVRAFKRANPNDDLPANTNSSNEKQFYKPLQYLGFEFNGNVITIRTSSLSRYFRKMRARIVKTVSMAYGAKGKSEKIFLKQLFQKYSHIGERNFIKYAYNACSLNYTNAQGELKDGLNSKAIKRQLRHHVKILTHNLRRKNEQRVTYKLSRKKPINLKATK